MTDGSPPPTRKLARPRRASWPMRRKLTLAFLLVTIVPLALALGVLALQVDREFRDEIGRRLEAAREGVGTRLDALEEDLHRALERIAADPIVGYLAQDLKWERFYGDQQREREIVREASRLMTAPQLDVLEIVDAARDGYVIAMGHRRGVEPADRVALAAAADPASRGMWRREALPRGSDTVPLWTIQAAHATGERLVLVGGRLVDRALLETLAAGLAGAPELVVRGPDGQVLASTFASGEPEAPERYEVAVVERPVGDGSGAVVTLSVHLSRAALHRTLADLLRFAAVLGVLGLLLSLLLGAWLSRTITRPLRALVTGAEAIARGRLDHRIPVRSRDEVGELVGRFNRMAAELEESQKQLVQAERVAAWKDIARQIAHEVKNPLFPIQTSVETLQRAWRRQHPRFDEICGETTRTVLDEVERLKHIVTEFSRFARLPAPRLIRADLNGLVHDSVVLFRDEAAGVAIDEALAEDLPPLAFDPTLMGQVTNNLVKNAVEAARHAAAPRVVVATSVHDDRVRITVDDNGPGVTPERREEIFRPYVTDKDGGTGLGLAVVHRIVSEHDGAIRVGAAPGGGARFEVELPARAAEPGGDVRPPHRPTEERRP